MSAAWLPRGFGRVGIVVLLLAGALLAWRWSSDPPTSRQLAIPDPVVGRALPLWLASAFSRRSPYAQSGRVKQSPLQPDRPHLVNLFASWCLPCRIETPVLTALAARGIRIDGVAVRDEPAAVARYLQTSGDLFASVELDQHGQVQAALGVAGLPETYVVDARGIIMYRHRGALNPDDAERLAERLR